MRFVAEPISNHRLQRFHRWAMLWLTWFAGFLETVAAFGPLSNAAEGVAHQWLDRITQVIVDIVVLRVVPRLRRLTPRSGVFAHRRIETSKFRAFIGTRTWRALRSRNLQRRIVALRTRLDVLVARVLRRIPCGLTRRRPIRPRRETHAAGAFGVFVAPVVSADTS